MAVCPIAASWENLVLFLNCKFMNALHQTNVLMYIYPLAVFFQKQHHFKTDRQYSTKTSALINNSFKKQYSILKRKTINKLVISTPDCFLY